MGFVRSDFENGGDGITCAVFMFDDLRVSLFPGVRLVSCAFSLSFTSFSSLRFFLDSIENGGYLREDECVCGNVSMLM